ncbi:hypothetical protein CTKZ_34150 [Cellulomonas algicola]|uniref:Uncharacterized protein n=1 Tax=Cellulomonas algicola TaxID=2071633 RepID=A0A401V4K6_9CELL|nr:hypothetical protein [Cellulomonas algicola]GCD21853.1 hypothetical protein CTKZ_34150 [Cellulomonas algicola]
MDFANGLCIPMPDNGAACLAWSGIGVIALLFVAVLAAALVPLLVSSRRTPTASQVAARANRHATLGSVTGAVLLVWVLGTFAVVPLVGRFTADGRVTATLPAIGGLCLVSAQALAQVTWPRPSGAVRHADLARRTRSDVVPAGVHLLMVVWTAALVVALLVFAAVADTPRTLALDGGAGRATYGPYPGLYYAVPVAIAALVLVVVTELVLRLVVLRPAVPGVSREWDLHLRRRSARHLVGGAQLALAASLCSVLALAGVVHRGAGQAALGTSLLGAAVAVAVVALAALLPLSRVRAATAGPAVAGVSP